MCHISATDHLLLRFGTLADGSAMSADLVEKQMLLLCQQICCALMPVTLHMQECAALGYGKHHMCYLSPVCWP